MTHRVPRFARWVFATSSAFSRDTVGVETMPAKPVPTNYCTCVGNSKAFARGARLGDQHRAASSAVAPLLRPVPLAASRHGHLRSVKPGTRARLSPVAGQPFRGPLLAQFSVED